MRILLLLLLLISPLYASSPTPTVTPVLSKMYVDVSGTKFQPTPDAIAYNAVDVFKLEFYTSEAGTKFFSLFSTSYAHPFLTPVVTGSAGVTLTSIAYGPHSISFVAASDAGTSISIVDSALTWRFPLNVYSLNYNTSATPGATPVTYLYNETPGVIFKNKIIVAVNTLTATVTMTPTPDIRTSTFTVTPTHTITPTQTAWLKPLAELQATSIANILDEQQEKPWHKKQHQCQTVKYGYYSGSLTANSTAIFGIYNPSTTKAYHPRIIVSVANGTAILYSNKMSFGAAGTTLTARILEECTPFATPLNVYYNPTPNATPTDANQVAEAIFTGGSDGGNANSSRGGSQLGVLDDDWFNVMPQGSYVIRVIAGASDIKYQITLGFYEH